MHFQESTTILNTCTKKKSGILLKPPPVYLKTLLPQSAEAVEYSDCISAKGQDSTKECSMYDTKQSDDEVPVKLEH